MLVQCRVGIPDSTKPLQLNLFPIFRLHGNIVQLYLLWDAVCSKSQFCGYLLSATINELSISYHIYKSAPLFMNLHHYI